MIGSVKEESADLHATMPATPKTRGTTSAARPSVTPSVTHQARTRSRTPPASGGAQSGAPTVRAASTIAAGSGIAKARTNRAGPRNRPIWRAAHVRGFMRTGVRRADDERMVLWCRSLTERIYPTFRVFEGGPEAVSRVTSRRTFAELLVALDGSPGSLLALDAAVGLGTAFRSRLHLLHVIPKLDEYARFANLLEPLVRELTQAGNRIVEEASLVVERAGLTRATVVREGVPAVELTEYAAEKGVSLIVMGSRGFGGKTNYALGSVSYQVAMRAPTSVLVVNGTKPFERILLAHDGSEDARLAADDVLEMAPKFGSKVAVSFIVPARPGGAFTLAGSPMEPFLLETEDRLRKAGIAVVRDLRYGHPAEELVKAARGYSLVAVGAQGRSDLALDYVGGVADKVLRNSTASILLVR